MENQYSQDGSAAAAAAAAVFGNMQDIHTGLQFDNVNVNGAYRQAAAPPNQVSQAYTAQQHYYSHAAYGHMVGQPHQPQHIPFQQGYNTSQQYQTQPPHQYHPQPTQHITAQHVTREGGGEYDDEEDGEYDPDGDPEGYGVAMKRHRTSSVDDNSKRRRGRPSGTKRRKATPDDVEDEDEDDESLFMRGEVKTKSGRRVAKPDAFDPTIKHPTKRRGRPPGPRKDPSLSCVVCKGGQSKLGNPIVFCDGCNRGWHQLCHVPAVDDIVTQLPDAEWYCNNCELKRARKKRKLEMGLTGDGLNEEERKTYLASLPVSHLLQIIMYAESQHPELPIYPPTIRQWLMDNHQKKLEDQEAINTRLHTVFASPHESSPSPEPERVVYHRVVTQPINTPSKIAYPSAYSNMLHSTVENGSPSSLPSYEEMIVKALTEIGDPQGSPPRLIYEWMNSNYPLQSNFKASASQALQKAVKKGRLLKNGSIYRLNPEFAGDPSPSRKATRKPMVFTQHPVYNSAGPQMSPGSQHDNRNVSEGLASSITNGGEHKDGGHHMDTNSKVNDSPYGHDPNVESEYAAAAAAAAAAVAAAAAANSDNLTHQYMEHVGRADQQVTEGHHGDTGADSSGNVEGDHTTGHHLPDDFESPLPMS